jgi:hypothetical protein
LIAIVGVLAGFAVTEKIFERKGIRIRRRRIRVSLEELPDLLQTRHLIQSAVIYDDKKILRNVDEAEIERAVKTLEESGSDELVLISGSDFRYIARKNDVLIYLRGKFVSMRDFGEVWSIIQNSLEVSR